MSKRDEHIWASNQVAGAMFCQSIRALVSESGSELRIFTGSVDRDENSIDRRQVERGCTLRRLPPWRRLLTWCCFSAQAFLRMLKFRGKLAVLTSNPPIVPWLAPLAAKLSGLRYGLVIYDVYPDVIIEAGLLGNQSLPARVLRFLSRVSLANAEFVVTLTPAMYSRLSQHTNGSPVEITIIPCWSDTDMIRPCPKKENAFVQQHKLTGKFVVMYSGEFSAGYDLASLLLAADHLRSHPNLTFLLIGGGTQEDSLLQLSDRLHLCNTQFLPWQPEALLSQVLTAADLHVVSAVSGKPGTGIPSKFFNALASGTAIAAICTRNSELAELIQRHACGIVVPPRRPDILAEAIVELASDPVRLAELRTNARRAAEFCYAKKLVLRAYRSLGKRFSPPTESA